MKRPPSIVQLPGGIKLQGLPFRVLEKNDDGSPRVFELLPKDHGPEGDLWFLYADERLIRSPR